jgi:hypothetical protein
MNTKPTTIYQLVICIGKRKMEFFFEEQETADAIADYVAGVSKLTKVKIKIEKNLQQLYSHKAALEQLKKDFDFAKYLGPN